MNEKERILKIVSIVLTVLLCVYILFTLKTVGDRRPGVTTGNPNPTISQGTGDQSGAQSDDQSQEESGDQSGEDVGDQSQEGTGDQSEEQAEEPITQEDRDAMARPYREELNRLENELDALTTTAAYTHDRGNLMVGFIPGVPSDMAYIREQAQAYGFTPVLIIDVNQDINNVLIPWMAEADWSWDIMLYAPEITGDTRARLDAIQTYLARLGRKDSDLMLLRGTNSTEAVRDLLQGEFVGYSVFHDKPVSGQNEDGTVHFDYSYIASDDVTIETRLSQAYKNRASMIYAFDMEAIRSGEVADAAMSDLLGTLRTYANKEGFGFATTAQVVKELSKINDILSEEQAELDAQIAELQQRIDELDQIIQGIYLD